MVTSLLTDALLRLAARRHAAPARVELLREWRAEVHILAVERERLAMLRFASSLFLSFPGTRKSSESSPSGPATAAYLVLAPLACVATLAIGLASLVLVMGLVAGLASGFSRRAIDTDASMESTLRFVLPVALAISAWFMTTRARRWARLSVLTRPLPLAAAAAASATAIPLALNPASYSEALALLTGLFLALWPAAALARSGRPLAAWLSGSASVFAALAIEVAVGQRRIGPEMLTWLPQTLGYLNPVELATQPLTGFMALLVVVLCAYALGFVISAAQPRLPQVVRSA